MTVKYTAIHRRFFDFSQERQTLNVTRLSPLEDTFESWFRGVPVWLPDTEMRASPPTQFRMDVN